MANTINNSAAAGSSALGIISGLFNTLNTGLSAVYNKKQQERANQYQIEAEQRQNQYNIEAEQRSLQYQKDLIDYTNEYNDPSAQAQRYADAGYNPYLVDVDSGQMSQPSSVDASVSTAQSGFTPDMREGVGLDSVADGVIQGLQYSLEKKKLQFENDKIDLARREFERGMFESDREFLHKRSMDLAEATFRRVCRNADERFRNREISLKERQQEKAEAHTAFEEARETANDNLALQRHNLSMRIGSLQYNKDEKEYKELFPEQIRNKKLKLQLENMLNDLSDKEKEVYRECVRKSEQLRSKMLDNEISFEDYTRDVRAVWDFWHRDDSRYKTQSEVNLRDRAVYSNPYESRNSSGFDIANLALKILGVSK